MLADAIIQRAAINIHVALPCVVLKWTPPVSAGSESRPALVDIQPAFKYARSIDTPDSIVPGEEPRVDSARGNIAVGTLPMILNVPVHYPGPAGMLSFGPIQVGECGLLICSDRSIDDWIQDGGPSEPVLRNARHSLTDAIFMPGLRYGLVAKPVDPLLYFVGNEDQTAGMSLHATTNDLQLLTDGVLTITKQGVAVATITMDAAGAVTITPAAGQSVNVGGVGAVSLAKAQTLETFLTTAANGVTGTPDVEAAFAAFALAMAGLADAIGTTKAKGI